MTEVCPYENITNHGFMCEHVIRDRWCKRYARWQTRDGKRLCNQHVPPWVERPNPLDKIVDEDRPSTNEK